MGTVRRELGAPRAAINHAFSEGRLTRKVAVHLPERSPARDRWLTREEAASVIKASKTPQARLYLPLFILIGLYTGRRKEAILSLRWPQVDPKAKLIDFEVEGREQTNKKRGKVRIPDRLLPHLVRARRRGTELGYVLHDHGKRIADVKKGFAAACRRAGLERRVMPHTLRHTAAHSADEGGRPDMGGLSVPLDERGDFDPRLRPPSSRVHSRSGRRHWAPSHHGAPWCVIPARSCTVPHHFVA